MSYFSNVYVMTVGDALPVNAANFDISRPMATKGRSTSAVISPCLLTSGSYFSMYMRTVAPTEPVNKTKFTKPQGGAREAARGREGAAKWPANRSHTDIRRVSRHMRQVQPQPQTQTKTCEYTKHRNRHRHVVTAHNTGREKVPAVFSLVNYF